MRRRLLRIGWWGTESCGLHRCLLQLFERYANRLICVILFWGTKNSDLNLVDIPTDVGDEAVMDEVVVVGRD